MGADAPIYGVPRGSAPGRSSGAARRQRHAPTPQGLKQEELATGAATAKHPWPARPGGHQRRRCARLWRDGYLWPTHHRGRPIFRPRGLEGAKTIRPTRRGDQNRNGQEAKKLRGRAPDGNGARRMGGRQTRRARSGAPPRLMATRAAGGESGRGKGRCLGCVGPKQPPPSEGRAGTEGTRRSGQEA